MRIVVMAPFLVLGLAFVATFFLSAALSSLLRGGHITFEQLGPPLAWNGFAIFAAVFLWLDAVVVGRSPERIWTSLSRMWWTTLFSTVGGVVISLGIAFVIGGLTVAAVAGRIGELFTVGIPACLFVVAVFGGMNNVRARRAARIVPRPF